MRRVAVGVVVLFVSSLTGLITHADTRSPQLVIGSTTTTQATALPGPTVVVEAPPVAPADGPLPPGAAPPPSGGVTMKSTDGKAYGKAIAFNSSIPVPSDLQFVLVVGSDARPGDDIRRTNGDSIHLLAVNPRTREGTIVGFPRDSWVEIPGRGQGKLTSALAEGGPGLMVETVRRLTGLPIQFYALTGFAGLSSMVDALGGVDVLVNRRMADRFSGAFFEAGWHHLNGAQALALTRNRHDTTNGDFGRSENQGTLILAALGKMRAEVGDDGGIRRWVDVLLRHAALELSADRLLPLAALARNLDPGRLRNLVVPGRIGNAGRASVVFLTAEAAGIFADLRDDAVIGGASAPPPPDPGGTPGGSTPPATGDPGVTTSTTTAPGTPPPLVPPITLFPQR